MKRLSILILVLAVCGSTQAQTVVTTAVPFLRISPDAGASGMASTGVATPPEAAALFYNVGKLAFAKERGAISANYAPWLKEWTSDMFLAAVGGYYKLSADEALSG